MAFRVFGGAEAGNAASAGATSGVYIGTPNDSIAAAPGGFPGAYAYCIDPVNGVVATETYGFETPISQPSFFTVPFMYRFAETGGAYDDEVSICELGDGNAGGDIARRLIHNTSAEPQILDVDEDSIGASANSAYFLKDTVYWALWYVDLRGSRFTGGGMSRDILWVYRPAVSVAKTATFADADPDTITMADAPEFIDGDVITVAGSASNNGSYTIDTRVAGLLTLDAGDALTNEGPVAVTLSTPARWDKAIDVTNHGDGVHTSIDSITFGTRKGKGLPTQGGPFYVKEVGVQVLNESPNTTPIGSITTVLKIPKANGADGDFNTGTGTNPNWEDVDEIPPDGATSYDEGDVAGDQQSYEPEDADVDDIPLAIQVIGQGSRNGATELVARTYILEDGTRDYSDAYIAAHTAYSYLFGAKASPPAVTTKTYNTVNGKTITESLFNTIEVGVEIVSIAAAATYRVSQIGAEYMIEGPKALPADFPATDVLTIVPGAMGPAIGSANVGLF